MPDASRMIGRAVMDNYERLNRVLVELFNETLEIERKYVEKSDFGIFP